MTSMSTDITTSASIDITTSTSIDVTTSMSIDDVSDFVGVCRECSESAPRPVLPVRPEDSFFFFGHRIIELGIIFSRTTPSTTWMHVCVFVRRLELTARIHIDVLNFSFFLVFHDRGKISWVFPRWRRSDFVRSLPGRFPLSVAGPVQRTALLHAVSREHFRDLVERCGVEVSCSNVRCWSASNVVVDGVAVTSLLVVEIVSWYV
ncbi:hypothetical protein F2Q68_00039558 [Brassica cretica]|uniref:Uncharacterized protein n=1 Tax=Brassica cretica TaxID=69181 RepID=A0A8S9MJM8_BRACR|nr:hypothetical protein F2Q68_00039558 [Brassica cretica]